MTSTVSPKMTQMKLTDIVPYDKNPRDNSQAVDAVAKSIEDFGFLVPIVVDKDNVIVAGHTRYEAAKKLKLKDFPVISAAHLDERQIQAFRIIDNKTSELATWDFDLLAGEISELSDSGIDLGQFGWTQEEIDCLTDMVQNDCLDGVLAEDAANGELHNRHTEVGDGLTGAIQGNKGVNAVSRDPKSVRVAVGEITFFVDIEHYREWAHTVRRDNGFDMQRVVNDLAGRLGLEARPFTRAPKEQEVDQEAMAEAKRLEEERTGKSRADIERQAAINKRKRPATARTRPSPDKALKKAVAEAEA